MTEISLGIIFTFVEDILVNNFYLTRLSSTVFFFNERFLVNNLYIFLVKITLVSAFFIVEKMLVNELLNVEIPLV